MAHKKSDAYLRMQKQFKLVGAKPQAFTSFEAKYVRKFEDTLDEIYKMIDGIKEYAKKGEDANQSVKTLQALLDNFYNKYVRSAKFKNHIDVWNEWQKLENRFNDELSVELEYAAPAVKGGATSPPGKKSAAYMKFQKKFISSVGLNPDKHTSLLFKYVKKFEDRIGEINKMLDDVAECEKKGEDTTQSKKTVQALMDNFYIKYIKNPKFKNHIDVWNEFMKLEDRFNELGINLSYAPPSISS